MIKFEVFYDCQRFIVQFRGNFGNFFYRENFVESCFRLTLILNFTIYLFQNDCCSIFGVSWDSAKPFRVV